MGLFKPDYYNEKKSESRKKQAMEKEKNPGRLRKAALDQSLDYELRAIAIGNLRDPEVCESVLMEYAGRNPKEGPVSFLCMPYNAAAGVLAELGDQARLKRLLGKCSSHAIQAIIVGQIKDPALLERTAIHPGDNTDLAKSAVDRIEDDAALARMAIQTTDQWAALRAAKRVNDEAEKGRIVLHSPYLDARIEAAKRMSSPATLAEPLRAELMPKIAENPTQSPYEAQLLAVCGDDVARIVLYCIDHDRDGSVSWGRQHAKEAALQADPDVLFPLLKRTLEAHLSSKNYYTMNCVPRVAEVIRHMHDHGSAAERIEAELPRTIDYGYQFGGCVGESLETGEEKETVTLW